MVAIKSNDYSSDLKQNMVSNTKKAGIFRHFFLFVFELIKQPSKQYNKGWTKKHFVFRTYPTQLEWVPPPATVTEFTFPQRHQVYRPWKNPEGYHIANTKRC